MTTAISGTKKEPAPKHRKPGLPSVGGYPRGFKPKHCGGATCFHIHHAETRVRWCCPTRLDASHASECRAARAARRAAL